MKKTTTWALVVALVVGAYFLTRVVDNRYLYYASYTILQYVILATAWNVLGGYCGYVNFGSGAFFGVGAYTSAMLINGFHLSMPWLVISGGLTAGLMGLALGYLTMRVRGIYFSIATLALSVVVATVILNIPALGGARGIFIIRPRQIAGFSNYLEFLFVVMVVLAVASVALARFVEKSWIGHGMKALRDDEEAAECSGVPVLRLKVFASGMSGFLMGVAGAPFPYFISFLEPSGAVGLDIAVNSLAMPLIGGTATWVGPVVGALLLGSAQQITTVTLPAGYNLLLVGVLMVGFVVFAPAGVVGLVQKCFGRGSA